MGIQKHKRKVYTNICPESKSFCALPPATLLLSGLSLTHSHKHKHSLNPRFYPFGFYLLLCYCMPIQHNRGKYCIQSLVWSLWISAYLLLLQHAGQFNITEDIRANTIDEAAEEILRVLKEKAYITSRTVSSRDNVFYLDGWDGLGASAVLRAVAQRLTTTSASADGKRGPVAGAGLEFDQVIHIDCSMWESRRALQRMVAEQLNLPDKVMELFDRQDEEDDFRGVAQGSRTEVEGVAREMYQHVKKLDQRFLVVFHNGSNEEIDLARLCGFSLSGYSTSKMLWTFQGRFRLKPRTKVDTAMKTAGTTDVFILLAHPAHPKMREELWPYLVLQESVEVAAACKVNAGSRGIINQSEQVTECFLYMWDLCCSGGQLIDYDLDTHGANYWVCDDIIGHGQQGDSLWRAAEALHREIRLDMDSHQYVPSPQLLGPWQIRSKPSWTSPTYGLILVPNGDMFQHCADKLCVLKLSRCTFDFRSPPFLCCHSLRFLWLDHCQGTTTRTSTQGAVAAKEEDIRQCFQRLWVLDVRHTDCCDQILSAQMLALMTQLRELNVIRAKGGWDIGQLRGRLPNIRKLRVKSCNVSCSCSQNDLFSEMNKMEHLDFSGNYSTADSTSRPMTTSLFGPRVSKNDSCLETVIVVNDGYYEFLQQISFSGCTQLKNLHLGGPMWLLHTLDISGTAVKTLDLSTTEILDLDELYLLDCKKLCAILWPPKDNMKREGLGKLCIDTTQSAPTAQSREEKAKRGTTNAATGTTLIAPHGSQASNEFDWYISVRDARLLASLEPVYSDSRKAYVEISSHPTILGGGSKDEGMIFNRASSGEQKLLENLQRQPAHAVYTDISVDGHLQQASEGGGDTLGIMWMWPCPDVPDLPEKRCYMHIQDQIRIKLPRGGEETRTVITVPKFVTDCAKILHVHDSVSITSITTSDEYGGSEWPYLEWCRIERCPRLESVFLNVQDYSFVYELRIFWASQLLTSHYIWTSIGYGTFPHLTLLHLDFCPRLIHALPLTWNGNDEDSLCLLETLEVAWCGDLREIFHFKRKRDKPDSKDFPNLKRIHLHELPSLQHICGVRMSAPNLETVKIRGCWSLRRLPDISGSSNNNKVVECDCEKEWWDRLEWDDRSQVEHYKPIHPQYYKRTLLRGTVLR